MRTASCKSQNRHKENRHAPHPDAAAVLTASSCRGALCSRPRSPQKITVTAKKYEFTPSTIEVKAGQPVEITFQSEDTKHGFECKELGIEKVVFDKDKPRDGDLHAREGRDLRVQVRQVLRHGALEDEGRDRRLGVAFRPGPRADSDRIPALSAEGLCAASCPGF